MDIITKEQFEEYKNETLNTDSPDTFYMIGYKISRKLICLG